MNSPRKKTHHRKRFSAVSSDSAVSTLPAYTSPLWKAPVFPEEITDQPPDYPDSAEEADADTETDGDESSVLYIPSPSQGSTLSRSRPSPARRSVRRHNTAPSTDAYLDSLLERSVHALEMSNALLHSSMSTQTSLASVLADDSMAERTLEARARRLTSRIHANGDLHDSWLDDLQQITEGVDRLGRTTFMDNDDIQNNYPVSKSLPSSGFAEHVRKRLPPSRRASLEFRDADGPHLKYSNHDRSHFIAPAPRALTMYIDTTDHPDMITLPATLGIRPAPDIPPTPFLTDTSTSRNAMSPPESAEQSSKAVDILSIYGPRRDSFQRSTSSLVSSKPRSTRSGRSHSTSSSVTMRKPKRSKSPPPRLNLDKSISSSPSSFHSRSTTRSGSPSRHQFSMTPPIEELSASSSSSSSEAFHVEQTVQSLRQILDRQRITSSASSPGTSKMPLPRPLPRPPQMLLNPPGSPPILGTSNATASVSRLFTKARHTTSTRPPSPPRHSALKIRSTPSSPVTSTPSPAHSMLSIPDALGVITGRHSRTSSTTSGASTPKRISFAELPESYSRSKPDGAPSRFKTRSHSRSRDKGKGTAGSANSAGRKGKEGEEGLGWWAKWLFVPGEAGSGMGGERYDERIARGAAWGARSGLSNGIEDWGA